MSQDDSSIALIRDSLSALDKKFDMLLDRTVPADWCNKHREHCLSENGQNFRELFDRVKECEEPCSIFKAMFPVIPSEADVLRAKSDAVESAAASARAEGMAITSRIDSIDSRLDNIENKLKILDLSYWSACRVRDLFKNNKVFAGFVIVLAISVVSEWLTFVGVLLGRFHDFLL